jgi:uncharacterized membrane protein YsdA (DUF1294 family)
MLILLTGYAIVLNLYGFLIMGSDKKRAVRRSRRIPEKRLFIIAAAGGAAGIYAGMRTFRHKTLHFTFTAGIPFLLICNVIAYYWLARHL